MRIKNRLFAHLAFIGIVATMQPLLAAEQSVLEPKTETWYQIEVLVFEPVEHTLANESWPALLSTNKPKPSIELMPISEKNIIKAFQQLPPEILTLAETANKLIRAGSYRIITLQGWQQPVKQRHEADAVHLTDKPSLPVVLDSRNIDQTFNSPRNVEIDTQLVFDSQGNIVLNPPTANLQSAEPLLEEAGLTAEEIPARVDGTVTVSLSRYLHMALNIRYYNQDVYLAEQIAQQKIDEVIIDTFELKQSRRMRSKEVHVFDHPYFGVIVTIIPVERIIPEAETQPLSLADNQNTQPATGL